jgi:hypothetical protein
VAAALPPARKVPSMLFAYMTPEVTLPLASALAAGVGLLVLLERAPLRVAAKALRIAAIPFRWAGKRFRSLTDKAGV